jgi:hypothetical protein
VETHKSRTWRYETKIVLYARRREYSPGTGRGDEYEYDEADAWWEVVRWRGCCEEDVSTSSEEEEEIKIYSLTTVVVLLVVKVLFLL